MTAQTDCTRDALAFVPSPNQCRCFMNQPLPVPVVHGSALVHLAVHLNTGSKHMTRTSHMQEEGKLAA